MALADFMSNASALKEQIGTGYQVWIGYEGMRDFPSNDDWKISPLKQRTVKELAKKAAKHNITYLRFQGEIPENLSVIFPAVTHLKVSDLPSTDHRGQSVQEQLESISGLKELISLDLQDNKLSALPDCFGCLRNLKTLNISENPLDRLPKSFADLQSLERLEMHRTSFTKFPSEACICLKLKHISIKDCQRLAKLNRRLLNLEGLQIMNTSGCTSLSKPPRDVCNSGADSVKNIQQFYIDRDQAACQCTLL